VIGTIGTCVRHALKAQFVLTAEKFSDRLAMQFWLRTCLKALWTAYFLLTSVYCLLAYLPYTYYAVIKAPPNPWVPWFAAHHVEIYWVLLLCGIGAYWPQRRSRQLLILFGASTVGGILLAFHPFLPKLQSNSTAYAWSIAALIPIILMALPQVIVDCSRGSQGPQSSLTYLPVVVAASAVCLTTGLGAKWEYHRAGHPLSVHAKDFELGLWSLVTHVVLAILIVSLLNLIFRIGRRTSHPRTVSVVTIGLTAFAALSVNLKTFLDTALSFQGWSSICYGLLLSAAVVLFCASFLLAWYSRGAGKTIQPAPIRTRTSFSVIGIVVMAGLALIVPSTVGEWDWNSVIQRLFTLALWVVLTTACYRILHRPRTYSAAATIAILLIAATAYKTLQATEFIWASSLGPTNEDVAVSIERYASQNISLRLADHFLGNAPEAEKCGELCRVLREYTNVRDAETTAEVRLVDTLIPGAGERPNIFIFVVDSMRPDYLGAYNPKVDFTPNIDRFANDSVVFRNAYSQYAGTTLSEPAIWAGAMLLHAHYVRPFSNVNSLEKLAKTDGYKMVVSYDTVLKEILSPADDLIKLDTDKPAWNEFEMCSTVGELNKALDERNDKTRPVFFYAQPMNVHMFAHNNLPASGWDRVGFNRRLSNEVHQVDDCMGEFVSGLKSRGLYDNSVIILTSDHGDATGELGRRTHSNIIYPEVMHVPLIIHLPKSMRAKLVEDPEQIATLTDIAPSLYYLLGHQPVKADPMYGHPLFADTQKELASYQRSEVFLASDEVAVYGFLDRNGRYLYATYDSPARSFLFDLANDPNAEHNILTAAQKKQYDERIIDYLKMIGDFYGYKPGVGTLLASGK
jgi:phosphoglycerol transferase MdoB-like AlkP superfamily enzyme